VDKRIYVCRKKKNVHITRAIRDKTQAMSMPNCSFAPIFAPDVWLGLLALDEPEPEGLLVDPLALVEDGGAAAARFFTEAHVAAAFVLVLPSR